MGIDDNSRPPKVVRADTLTGTALRGLDINQIGDLARAASTMASRTFALPEGVRAQLDMVHAACDPLTKKYQDLQKANDHVRRLAELDGTSQFRLLVKQISQHQDLVRLATGPVDELRKAGILTAALGLGPEIGRFSNLIADYEGRFKLPAALEASAILAGAHSNEISRLLAHSQPDLLFLNRAVADMQSPWLDSLNVGRSVAAFADIQGIGQVLSHLPAFDVNVARALRSDLGDWRDTIQWPTAIFTDPVARLNFYGDRGFKSSLTDFPAAAFDESVSIAGLREALADEDGSLIDPEGKDEEEGFARTNAAHGRLLRFELRVRRFIDDRMRDACGKDWIKHRIPGTMSQAWHDKRRKALDDGQPEFPLIAYADFTDYMQIITQVNNWKDVFKPVFRRQENVREAFQRLYPIRICTMHARLITLEDELYLYAEITRITRAIRRT